MSAQMCIYVTNSAELYKNATENRKVHICKDFFFWFKRGNLQEIGILLGVSDCEELVGLLTGDDVSDLCQVLMFKVQ